MSRKFICDNCGDEFNQALDEVVHKDGNDFITIDLCAECRGELKQKHTKVEEEFIVPIVDKIKKEKNKKKK